MVLILAAAVAVIVLGLALVCLFFRGRRVQLPDALDHATLTRVVDRHERDQVGSDS
jgi:hypothetical protein